jgi:HEAT repeat protein
MKEEPTPCAAADLSRNSVFLRLIGAVLILAGAVSLVSLIGLPDAAVNLWGGFRRSESAWLLGRWTVTGWAAYAISAVEGAVSIFAGVQLIRIKRSGWIAASLLLAYLSLSLAIFLGTVGVASQVENVIRATGSKDPLVVSLMMDQYSYHIAKTARYGWYFVAVYAIPIVYLLAEWQRFFGRPRRVPHVILRWTALAVCLGACLWAGVWPIWGAQYMQHQEYVQRAKSANPTFAHRQMQGMPPAWRAEITAIMARRLAAERSRAIADAFSKCRFAGVLDVTAMTPEDVPAILAAADAPDLQVRIQIYQLLGVIATRDAAARLRRAVEEGSAGEEWETAVWCLAKAEPERLPDSVLKRLTSDAADISTVLRCVYDSRDPRLVAILCRLAFSGGADLRELAIRHLSYFPVAESEGALITALKDPEPRIRADACSGLVQVGGSQSIRPLVDVLSGKDDAYSYTAWGPTGSESLREQAAWALCRITGQRFDTDSEAWRNWWDTAGPEFRVADRMATALLPMPPAPPGPEPTNDGEDGQNGLLWDEYYAMRSDRLATLQRIPSRNLRSLAPQLARYLTLDDEKAPYKFIAARVLAGWRYREGIDWLISGESLHGPGSDMHIIETLSRATGVNFSSDKKRWQEWWAKNRNGFRSAKDGGKHVIPMTLEHQDGTATDQ